MRRRHVPVLAWMVIAVAAMSVATPAVEANSDRDLAFARGLLARRWFDLAEQVAKKIEDAPGVSIEGQAEAGFLRADILKQKAQSTGDQTVFAAYQKLLEELQQRYPNAQRAQFAVVDQLLAQANEADSLARRADQEADPDEAKRLKEQATALYKAALSSFTSAIAGLTQQIDALSDEQAETTEARDLEYKRDLLEYLEASAHIAYGRMFPADGNDRKKWLAAALKKLDSFLEERTGWFNLWSFAYRDRGVALMGLGQYEDAKMVFEEMTGIQPWVDPDQIKDPQSRKDLLEFVRSIALECHFQHAQACNKAKAHTDALESVETMFERDDLQAARHHFGKLAMLEKGKALSALGKARKGALEVYRLVEESRDGPDKVADTGLDVYGITACKALSEMNELSGEVFPAAIQFHAALGFFFRGESEKGIWAYKGVLVTAAGTEGRHYAARALKELGDLYYHIDRPIESALAYRQLYKLFPDSEFAGECRKRARTAVRKAVESFGEKERGPFIDLQQKIESDLQASDEGIIAEQLKFNNAAEAQKRSQYQKAANLYLEINEQVTLKSGRTETVPFYVNALSNAGYCLYRHFKTNPEGNRDVVDKAEETLRRAEQAALQRNSRDDRALALYFLAQLCNDPEVNKLFNDPASGVNYHEKALEVLAPFDSELSSSKKYQSRARYEQIAAALALGRTSVAKQAFAAMDRAPYQQEDSYRLAAFELGQSLVVADENSAGLSADQRQDQRKDAALYVHKWYSAAKAKPSAQHELTLTSLEWAATVALNGGLLSEAREVFDEILARFPVEKAKPDQFRLYARVDLSLAWCELHTGAEEAARDRLSQLAKAVIISERDGDSLVDVWHGHLEGKPNFMGMTVVLDGPADVAGQTKQIKKRDRTYIVTRFNREFRLIEGLARAQWSVFEKLRKAGQEAEALRMLGVKASVGPVGEAWQNLYIRLRNMDDANYQQLAVEYELETDQLGLRRLQTFHRLVTIKFIREDFAGVVGDINVQLQQGLLDDAIELKDGRILNGQITTLNANTVVLRTRQGEKSWSPKDLTQINDYRVIRQQIVELRTEARKRGG